MASPDPAAPSSFRRAIARLTAKGPGGPVRGTAFLVDPEHALTALHCVADRRAATLMPYAEIRLDFAGHGTTATVVPDCADARADFALLRLATPPPGVRPLPVAELLQQSLDEAPETDWRTLGFPDAKPDGIEVVGRVRSAEAAVEGVAALQLFSEEAAAGTGAPLSGLSGAPVIVDGAVVGLLRWATLDSTGRSVAGSLFACPLRLVREGLSRAGGPTLRLEEPPCPYPGLVSFSAADAQWFFGRQREIDWLLEHTLHHRLLMVIGPSASGKSSLIQAGLLPRLPATVLVQTLRPTPAALETLAQAPSLAESQPAGSRLLLFIDQLEELFTLHAPSLQHEFCRRLKALQAAPRVAVLLALRADFFPELMRSDLWPIEPEQRLEVAPLRGEALRSAIAEPAARVAVKLEPALIERLIADAQDEPGALPLIQETLVQLWQKRQHRRLTLAAYEALAERESGSDLARSGLAAAIARHAESVLAEMSEPERNLARRIFLRLVHFGEGRPNTRRQQTLDALQATSDEPQRFRALLDRLIAARLLTSSSAPSAAAGTETRCLDLAHEALLQSWPRLRRWIAEMKQAERTRRRLEDAAAEWARLSVDGGGLLDAVELREAEDWLASADARDLGVSERVQSLIEKSREALQRAEAAKAEQQRRETEQTQTLLRERSASRLLWRTVALLLIPTAVILAGLAVLAVLEGVRADNEASNAKQQSQRAEAQARVANAHRLAAQAQRYEERALDLALLLAVAADRTSSDADSQTSLLSALEARPGLEKYVRGPADSLTAMAVSKDGQKVAAARYGGTIDVFAAATGQPLGELRVATDVLFALAFSPDGSRLAAGGQDERLHLFDLETMKPAGPPIKDHFGTLHAVAFSPNGRYLASGAVDRSILLYDAVTGLRVGAPLKGHTSTVTALAFSADSKRLASGSDDNSLRVWDPTTGQQVAGPLLGHTAPVRVVSFAPDGQLLASGGWDQTVRLWQLPGGKPLGTPLAGHSQTVAALAFSADGSVLASGSWDQTVALWDVKTREPLGTSRRGHAETILAVAAVEPGRIVSGSADGVLLHWSVRPAPRLERATLRSERAIRALTRSSDGQLLAMGDQAGQVHLFDLGAGKDPLPPKRSFSAHEAAVVAVAISPDRTLLATGSQDKTIRLFRLPGLQPTGAPWSGHEADVLSLAFAADGQRLISGGSDGALRLWEVPSGRLLAGPLTGHGGPVTCVGFASQRGEDGKPLPRLVSASLDLTLRLWDAVAGKALEPAWQRHQRGISACALAADGSHVLTGSEDETLLYWSVATGKPVSAPWRGLRGAVVAVALSPDGQRAVAADTHGFLALWEVPSGLPIGRSIAAGSASVSGLAFGSDGNSLYVAGQDGVLRVLDFDRKDWQALACGLAGRDLSPVEQKHFLTADAQGPVCEARAPR